MIISVRTRFLLLLSLLSLQLGAVIGIPQGALTYAIADKKVLLSNNVATRLPESVIPLRYDIDIHPDLAKGCFAASENIVILIKAKRATIILNAVDLNIEHAALRSLEQTQSKSRQLLISYQLRDQIVTLKPVAAISPGKYCLSLSFSGSLDKHLRGFYAAKTKDESGKEVRLAVTQCEPADARRIFPCFDEPAFKAIFKLTTSIDQRLEAISNAPVDSRINHGGKAIVSFKETAKMSTYLFALFIGPFKPTAAKCAQGIPIRIWSVGHPSSLGLKAQEFACKFLDFYTQYFGIGYPERKLDLIAIPDFEAGAMENLGAISFRETALLFDAKRDSLASETNMASIIAHEMAHMWFGDLVTMSWWDDIWLNEAFATWMSHKAIEHVKPSWQTWSWWAQAKEQSMKTDALLSTHPIAAPVSNPVEALEMFDDITYAKGASILRMLEEYVSEDVFRNGIRLYMRKFQFANATTEELWEAIAVSSKKPISKVMEAWVHQPGYPLVEVTSDKPDGLLVSQKRFLTNQAKRDNFAMVTPWAIPLGYRLDLSMSRQQSSQSHFLLDSNQAIMPADQVDEPYLCNTGAVGFFRVLYPEANLVKLAAIKNQSLTSLERYALLTDRFAFCFAGIVPAKDFLPFLESFSSEEDALVTVAVCDELNELYNLLDSVKETGFASYVNKIVSPIAKRLGWEAQSGDSTLSKLARSATLSILGTYGGDLSTITQARQYLRRYLANQDSVSPDIIGAVESIVAYNGSSSDYAIIDQLSRTAKTPSSRKRALYTLPLFREKDLVRRTLALSLSNRVKLQDAPGLLASLLRQKSNHKLGWEFLQANWAKLVDVYPSYMIGQIIQANSSIATDSGAREFLAFFSKHMVPEAERDFKRTAESVQNNLAFLRCSRSDADKWLAENE
jgi:puromycin-sensitive aminopeptidase